MTRAQFILALVAAVALGIALGWFARAPEMQTRARDSYEALKKLNADRSGAAPAREGGRP